MIFISQLHTFCAIRSACLIRISTCNHVTDHFAMWSDTMAGRKRPSSSTSVSESSSSDGSPASKRRMLLAKSVNKWIAEHDKELNTSHIHRRRSSSHGRLDMLRLYSFKK